MKPAAATQLEFYFLDTDKSVHDFDNSVIIPFRAALKRLGYRALFAEQNAHIVFKVSYI